MTAPQRVVAYVTRGDELLVFTEDDDPDVQVPAGRLDPGEDLETALHRELLEEAGVVVRIVRELGASTRRRTRGTYESHYFHCETDDPRDAWDHVVTGDGADAGQISHCRFVPLDGVDLVEDFGEFLHRLA